MKGSGNVRTHLLGSGVYTIAEVARYAQLHPSRVRSWFKVRSDRAGSEPVFKSDCEPVQGDFAVSFLDLVDTWIAGQFRGAGVSMPTIRSAFRRLCDQLETTHAFCHHSLYTDGKRIFVHTAKAVNDATLTEVVSRQQFFLHVKDCLTRMDYSADTNLAKRWRIRDRIVIDPAIAFGKPVVSSTGVATFILAKQYLANDRDASVVADLYSVTEDDVEAAVVFEKEHGQLRAA